MMASVVADVLVPDLCLGHWPLPVPLGPSLRPPGSAWADELRAALN